MRQMMGPSGANLAHYRMYGRRAARTGWQAAAPHESSDRLIDQTVCAAAGRILKPLVYAAAYWLKRLNRAIWHQGHVSTNEMPCEHFTAKIRRVPELRTPYAASTGKPSAGKRPQ